MNIKFNDLLQQNKVIYHKSQKIFKNILDNSRFIGGEGLYRFETNFKKKVNSSFCTGLGNGTDGLIISLKCLGIGKGDEVITTAHSWVATAGAIIACGAKPVFVDVDDYFCIDPLQIKKKINRKTKAIIPVHLYGQACEIDKIINIAKKNNLKVIEDCAQSHLTKFKNKIVGSFGDIGVFSFFPGKNLGAFGDAGAVVTNNKNLHLKIKKFANHGSLKKNVHETFGVNSRLDELQALILNEKLNFLEIYNKKRFDVALKYFKLIKRNNLFELPKIREKTVHTFHQYVIKIKKNKRKQLIEFLKKRKIPTGLHYPKMIINLKPYKKFNINKKDFVKSLENEGQILSLPIHPFLKDKEIKHISDAINLFAEQNVR